MNAKTDCEFRTPVQKFRLLLPFALLVFSGGGIRAAEAPRERGAPGDESLKVVASELQTPDENADTEQDWIRQIESALDRQLSALATVVGHETIARYSRTRKAESHLDTLDANVEVIDGTDKYSTVQGKRKVFRDMRDVKGTWSVGEAGTLLRISRDAFRLGMMRTDGDEAAGPDGALALRFAFSYPASSRRWYLKVESQIYWMPFEGHVWISPQTGEVLRICWRASDLPPESGVSEIVWTVDFGPVDLASHTLTLPVQAVYQVTYEPARDRVDRNVTQFSEYRRYGTSISVHFDE